MTYTAFVNADSGAVTVLEGDPPVYAFMTRDEVADVGNDTDGRSRTTVRVVVTDENGTIVGTRNISVPDGGSVQVEVHDNGTTSGSSGT